MTGQTPIQTHLSLNATRALLIKISSLEFSVTTVESRIKEPVYNEVLGITNDFLQPVKVTVKCTE